MQKVTDLTSFKKAVRTMAKQKDARLFHCYVAGDIFKIATAKKVQQFDFSEIKSEKKIMQFLSVAIQILRKELPQQYLLLDETCLNEAAENCVKQIN